MVPPIELLSWLEGRRGITSKDDQEPADTKGDIVDRLGLPAGVEDAELEIPRRKDCARPFGEKATSVCAMAPAKSVSSSRGRARSGVESRVRGGRTCPALDGLRGEPSARR